MPGVGVRAVARLLTEVTTKTFSPAGHFAAYAGLAPRRSLLHGEPVRGGVVEVGLLLGSPPAGRRWKARYRAGDRRRGYWTYPSDQLGVQ